MSMRLKFAVVGLGQCGGNIANTFAKYGYPTVAFNTSILDLKDLTNIPDTRRVHIPLENSDGAGKDPRVGEEAIGSHSNTIASAVSEILPGVDAILITAGLGGGTGSNIALLGKLLNRFNLPLVVLTTIPTNNEAALAKINALRSVNQLVGENFHSCVIVDNEKILQMFPNGMLDSFYAQANDYVVKTFHEFNSINAELNSRSIISFDNEDFRRVLLSHGLLIFGETQIQNGELQSLEELLPRLGSLWQNSGLMAEGFDYRTSAIGAVTLFAPTSILQRTSSKFLKLLAEEFHKLTSGATSYFGLYEVPDDQPIRITTMLGRLAIPDRLKEMLTKASNEGETLSRKLSQTLPKLDISSIDKLDLHGAAPRHHQGSVGPAAPEMSLPKSTDVFIKPAPKPQTANPEEFSNAPELDENGKAKEFRSYSVEEYVRLKKKQGGS